MSYYTVELVRDKDTRNAHVLRLLYGPISDEVPGTDEGWRREQVVQDAQADRDRAGLDKYVVSDIRRLDDD